MWFNISHTDTLCVASEGGVATDSKRGTDY